MSDMNMEARIHAHIDRLFVGAPIDERVSEVKLEIYMNTVERYHDLVSEGKDAENAYREAISTIGDVGEILASLGVSGVGTSTSNVTKEQKKIARNMRRRLLRVHLSSILWMVMLSLYFVVSFATSAWYITWLVFLITPALQNVMKAIIDLVSSGKPDVVYLPTKEQKNLHSSLHGAWWLLATVLYFIISFATSAWYITWIIFLLAPAGSSLLSIIMMYTSKGTDPKKGGQL